MPFPDVDDEIEAEGEGAAQEEAIDVYARDWEQKEEEYEEEEGITEKGKSIALETIKEYCESTTLHGFAYVVGAPLVFERILWGSVIILFFSYVSTALHDAIKGWIEDPTVTQWVKNFISISWDSGIFLSELTLCFTPWRVSLFPLSRSATRRGSVQHKS